MPHGLSLEYNQAIVTDAFEPNEADCILLIGADFPHEAKAEEELREGLPFLEIRLVEQPEFDWYVERHFSTDRDDVPKGMLEVVL